jgi:hypothetical protein
VDDFDAPGDQLEGRLMARKCSAVPRAATLDSALPGAMIFNGDTGSI